MLRGARIQANAHGGDGGNISIVTEFLLADVESVIEASSELGIDGSISVRAPDTNLISQLATLPESPLDVADLLTSTCGARTARAGSFVVQRRGALAPPLDAPLDGFYAGGSGVAARAHQPQTQLEPGGACRVDEARVR